MSKSLRLSEKWFKRGLWLVAFVFAGFLIGLGGTIVGDLPKVEQTRKLDDFLDREQAETLRERIRQSTRQATEAGEQLEQARLQAETAHADVRSTRQALSNWLATRRATARAEQDPQVIELTEQLDKLQARARQADAAVEAASQLRLDAQQAHAQAQRQLTDMQDGAREAYNKARRAQELRVFGYRLLLTLPLLGLAAWLFVRQRRSRWWPFVWGFVLFAGFTFFVELVPYLPSYGGYVRYTVGIIMTALIGRWAIVALQRYLERQQAAEAQPEVERRKELPYDTALARLAKGVCPGCERPVDLKDGQTDFCPHCGIGLYERCGSCQTRRSSFAKYCHSCGAAADTAAGPAPHGAIQELVV